ncbi:acetyltransferase [Rufibacter sp. LB8]|uniref:acetyltransferase n=1 Tax=Rufibacter sp. LB8 TaxID=2777781 RepID=UPI00178C4146|nr:acetyltransferase [Rufibacter sp. LB8]
MSTEKQPIVIVGAGGLGREVLMLLLQINHTRPTWEIMGFYDDAVPVGGLLRYPYLGTIDQLNIVTSKTLHVAVAIGSCQAKSHVVQRLTNPFLKFPVLLHPSVIHQPEQENQLGEGTIICQNSILTTNIKVGKHVFVNLACTIGHDAVLDDFCSLMPQVAISGGVRLGKGVYFGTNSSILQNLNVGVFTTVGAGAVVTQNLPSYATAVGVPARVIRQTA